MSIEGIVARFGRCLHVFRATTGIATDGQVTRSYARVFEVHGFLQPQGQTEEVAQGRMQARTAGAVYIAGCHDIRIDDELHDYYAGGVRTWRVNGVINPGDLGETGLAPHLNQTVVSVVEVEPEVTL